MRMGDIVTVVAECMEVDPDVLGQVLLANGCSVDIVNSRSLAVLAELMEADARLEEMPQGMVPVPMLARAWEPVLASVGRTYSSLLGLMRRRVTPEWFTTDVEYKVKIAPLPMVVARGVTMKPVLYITPSMAEELILNVLPPASFATQEEAEFAFSEMKASIRPCTVGQEVLCG